MARSEMVEERIQAYESTGWKVGWWATCLRESCAGHYYAGSGVMPLDDIRRWAQDHMKEYHWNVLNDRALSGTARKPRSTTRGAK